MYNIGNIDWYTIFIAEIALFEHRFDIKVNIDEDIIYEIKSCVEDPRLGLAILNPNIAQITGYLVFWINELKPLSRSNDSKTKYNFINERIALMTGLRICSYNKRKKYVKNNLEIPKIIFKSIITNLRYNIYSPESLINLFEVYYCIV